MEKVGGGCFYRSQHVKQTPEFRNLDFRTLTVKEVDMTVPGRIHAGRAFGTACIRLSMSLFACEVCLAYSSCHKCF